MVGKKDLASVNIEKVLNMSTKAFICIYLVFIDTFQIFVKEKQQYEQLRYILRLFSTSIKEEGF